VHESVPTVSDVVSRLGRASEALGHEADALEHFNPAAGHDDDVPTVSMLGAMVEALTALDSAEPETAQPAPAEQTETSGPYASEEFTLVSIEVAEPEAELAAVETPADSLAAEAATIEPQAIAEEAAAPETHAVAEA